jgi:uncharacterized protein YhaN
VRFERIDLTKYGPFEGESFPFSARTPDFYVLYGDNEAGKSSLLRAISSLLFGIEPRTRDGFRASSASSLRVGAVISAGGEQIVFQRRKGNKATLLGSEGNVLSDESLIPFLGALDSGRFKSFYGLNHESLVAGGAALLEGKGDIGKALFEASGLLGLRRVLNNLEERSEAIFVRRASSKTLNNALAQYTQLRADMRKHIISRESAESLYAQLKQAREAQESAKTELRDIQTELIRLRRIRDNKPELANVARTRNQLEDLKNVPALEKDARARREKAQHILREAQTQIATLNARIDRRNRELSTLPRYDALKRFEPIVRQLNEQTGKFRTESEQIIRRKRDADAALRDATETWGRAFPGKSIDEADALRAFEARKQLLRKLITDHSGLTARERTLRSQLTLAIEERNQKAQKISNTPAPPDTGALVAAMEVARGYAEGEERANRLRTEAERLLHNARRACDKMPHWTGDLERLQNMRVPLPATVSRFGSQFSEFERQKSLRQMEARKELEDIQNHESRLNQLNAQRDVPDDAVLKSERDARDRVWRIIRQFAFEGQLSLAAAQEQVSDSDTLPVAFERITQQVDTICDIRVREAETVAQMRTLGQQIQDSRQRAAETATKISELSSQFAAVRENWQQEWPDLPDIKLTPEEVQEWLKDRASVLELVNQSLSRVREAEDLERTIDQRKIELRASLASLTISIADTESLAVMLARASKLSESLTKMQNQRALLEQEVLTLDGKVHDLERQLKDCCADTVNWTSEWQKAVDNTQNLAQLSPSAVEAMLLQLQDVFKFLDKHRTDQYRVQSIGDNIEAFKQQVLAVVEQADPSLSAIEPDQAVVQLSARLEALRQADVKRAQAQEEIAADQGSIEEWQDRQTMALLELSVLRQNAGCGTDAELLEIEVRAEQKLASLLELHHLEESLVKRNSMDLQAIADEAAAFLPSALDLEIHDQEDAQQQIVDKIGQHAKNSGDLERQVRQLEQTDNAAKIAQESEEVLTQIQKLTDEYVRLSLCVQVIRRAMDIYREKNQAPILKRASEIFSSLTIGEHTELVADFNDKDEAVIFSRRRNGERTPMEGLSEGTRDQLYLSLRIAAIEMQSDQAEPIPVILDDILINSDDTRAQATLTELARLATKTQVLFFTHHRHLTDIAVESGATRITVGAKAAAFSA